jgi:hypothetical protein
MLGFLQAGLEAHPQHVPKISELIALQDKHREGPVFTSKDLSSLNVLASKDDAVDIVDWETAEWSSAYWEHTTAWHANPPNQF